VIRRTVVVRARKMHRCDACGVPIERGQPYLVLAASPQHGDLGNVHWWRLKSCFDCDYSRPPPVG
jgi:hypothetical protein